MNWFCRAAYELRSAAPIATNSFPGWETPDRRHRISRRGDSLKSWLGDADRPQAYAMDTAFRIEPGRKVHLPDVKEAVIPFLYPLLVSFSLLLRPGKRNGHGPITAEIEHSMVRAQACFDLVGGWTGVSWFQERGLTPPPCLSKYYEQRVVAAAIDGRASRRKNHERLIRTHDGIDIGEDATAERQRLRLLVSPVLILGAIKAKLGCHRRLHEVKAVVCNHRGRKYRCAPVDNFGKSGGISPAHALFLHLP